MLILVLAIYNPVMASLVERDKDKVLTESTSDYCQLILKPEFPEIFSKGRALETLYHIFQSIGLTENAEFRYRVILSK